MKCFKCGTEIKENEKFCSNCGSEIIKKENIDNIQKEENLDKNIESKPNKKKNNKIIFIIIGILVIATLGCVIFVMNKSNDTKDKKEEVKNEKVEDNTVHTKDESNKEPKSNITIYITENKDEEYISTYEVKKDEKLEAMDDEKVIATYNCKNVYCRALEDDNKNYVLILDSLREIYLYSIKDKKATYYDVFENISGYADPILVSDGKKAYGMIYYTYSSDDEEEKEPVYYSFKDKKVIFTLEKNYSLNYINSYLQKGYLIAENKTTNLESLIDIKTGKTFKTIKDITSKDDYKFYDYLDDKVLAVESADEKINVLDNNFNLLFKSYYKNINLYNEKYYAYNNESKEYSIYDIKTKKEDKISLEYPIYDIIDSYVMISKNDKIVILDNNKKEIAEVDTASEYLETISGYYEGHDGKPSGIYLIFEKINMEDDSCNGREYHFDTKTNKLTKYILNDCNGAYAKPVLYLYPTKTTKVTVNFEKESMLTTTYPKFNKEWKVTAHKNGDLYDENGNYYYALYWEEEKNHTVDFSEGFYVTKENAITFLEEKLTYIGLNAKERNEFIMYWLPILEKNKKNLVYFELTEERDNYNKIYINPKPDSLLRVAIHVKKVDKKINIKEQKLTQFKRSGFTAVEWGGVKY